MDAVHQDQRQRIKTESSPVYQYGNLLFCRRLLWSMGGASV